MSVKENINLELECMLEVREDIINNITKVLKCVNLQDITKQSLENEIHRLKGEIETIREAEERCNLNFDNRNLIELSDREIDWILVMYEHERSQSELWSQELCDLHDKLSDALNKNN